MNKFFFVCVILLLLTGCNNGSASNNGTLLGDIYDSFFQTPEVLPTHTPRRIVIVDPQITLEPISAYAGSYVNVSGLQWPPGQIVVVALEDENGRSGVLAAATVDSAGNFSTGFLFPVNQRWLQTGHRALIAYTPDDSVQTSASLLVAPPDEVAALQTASPALIATATISATTAPAQVPANTATRTVTPTITVSESPTATAEAITDRQTVDPLLFQAEPASPVNLDGDLTLWPNGWIPIRAVVWGADNYTGDSDLSADFQLLWSSDGLYIAVRVQDDLYRSGPAGTNMWQGDSFEIQFDRLLAEDFDDPVANGDDYQLGISFGPDLNEIRAYRWLPAGQEGAVTVPGAVLPIASGYQVEFLLPWLLFDMGPQDVFANATFGFNLSVNDNDADLPAQQTTISASPNRTDHKTPTEWGTLFLLPTQ